MNKLTIQTFTGLIILMFAGASFSQHHYFGYAEEPVNPRSVGMGCSGTASSKGGYAFYNPAGIATAESSFVAFEYGQQWSDISRGLVETAWIFPRWFIGASFQTQSNTFQITDNTGSEILPGSGAEQASVLSLLFGWRNKRYAIGASINGLPHHIYDRDAFALSASGGVTVSILPEKLVAGAALLHAGRYHRGFYDSTYEFHRDSMPTIGRIGCMWNDTILGRLPVSLSIDAAYSSNYQTFMVPVGCEVKPIQPLAIRFGKRFNLASDLFTAGVGFTWENISFDAAFTPANIEGDFTMKWLMGLRYAIAGKKSRAAKNPAAVKTPLHSADSPANPAIETGKKLNNPPLPRPSDPAAAVPAPAVNSDNRQSADSAAVPLRGNVPSDGLPETNFKPDAVNNPPYSSMTPAVPAAETPPVITDDNPASSGEPADSTRVQQSAPPPPDGDTLSTDPAAQQGTPR